MYLLYKKYSSNLWHIQKKHLLENVFLANNMQEEVHVARVIVNSFKCQTFIENSQHEMD